VHRVRQQPDPLRRDLLLEHPLDDPLGQARRDRCLLPGILRLGLRRLRLLLGLLVAVVAGGHELGRQLLGDRHERGADRAGDQPAGDRGEWGVGARHGFVALLSGGRF